MTINQQSFLVSNMCGEFMVCGCMQVSSDNVLNRAVCSEESRVMFIEGVPPLPCRIVCVVRRLRKRSRTRSNVMRMKLISTSNRRANSLVLPSRCKSGWHSPPKSYCAVLALCVVRTLDFAGWQLEQAG